MVNDVGPVIARDYTDLCLRQRSHDRNICLVWRVVADRVASV